jgi:hypothetical protein
MHAASAETRAYLASDRTDVRPERRMMMHSARPSAGQLQHVTARSPPGPSRNKLNDLSPRRA